MSKLTSFVFICVLSLLGVRNSNGQKYVTLQKKACVTALTPFDENEKLATDKIKPIAQVYKKSGLTCVYISAYYGGGPSLNLDERKALVDAWVEQTNALGMDLIVEIGAAPFVQVLEFAAYCNEKNVSALTAFAEIVYQPENESELLEDMEKICSAAPNCSVFYHELSIVGQEIGPVLAYLSACGKVSCFAGVLGSIDKLLTIRASTPCESCPSCQFITDENQQFVPGLILNATAATSVGLNLCPGTGVEAARLVKEGKMKEALEKQEILDNVVKFVTNLNGGCTPTDDTSRTYFENIKAAFYEKWGIETGVRYPQEKPNATYRAEIRSNLAKYNCY